MSQLVSIFASRTDLPSKNPGKIGERRVLQGVRSSLVQSHGKVYPGFVSPAYWQLPDSDDEEHFFVHDRATPPFDFQLRRDGSWVFTRWTTPQEGPGPVLFLEALTWEIALTLKFANRLAKQIKRAGKYDYGVTLSGFDGAFADWSGFVADHIERVSPGLPGVSGPKVERSETDSFTSGETYGIWRYKPDSDPMTTYVPDVKIGGDVDSKKREWEMADTVAMVVDQASQWIQAERGFPQRTRYRAILDPKSIHAAAMRALESPKEKFKRY